MAAFSDWGAAAWSEDLDAAKTQAETWLASTASAKSWPSAARAFVTAAIEQSAEAADGWFTDDVPAFWSMLAGVMDTYTGSKPANWDKLRATFASGGQTSTSTAAAREEGSVSTVVGGTVAATVEDVEDVAAVAKSKGPLVLLGLAGLGVVVWAATR